MEERPFLQLRRKNVIRHTRITHGLLRGARLIHFVQIYFIVKKSITKNQDANDDIMMMHFLIQQIT